MSQHKSSFFTICLAAACLACTGTAMAADSGQRTFGQVTVEPAVDATNGNPVYLLTPGKAPAPQGSNQATAPLYLTLYPLASAIPASEFNCLPTNCEHVNVLPFHFAGYDAQAAASPACLHFNAGQECALLKGHDHLLGVSPSGGNSAAACHAQLVVFTAKAFGDGAIHNRIKTVNQIQTLLANNDVMIVDTPLTFHCNLASKQTYEIGKPVVIPFP